MDADRDRLVADLATILDISRAMGRERDLGSLLDLIIAGVSRLIQAERSSLFLIDRERGELWTTVAQGSSAIRLPLGKGIAGTVAADGQTINIPRAYDDPRFNPANDIRIGYTTRSILCMALRNHRDEVVGVIQALNKRSGEPFVAYDEEVLGALCSQAAVAIENARLIESERERQRLERELELAADIQAGLLPDHEPATQAWRVAGWSRPCDETGGDYYDWIEGREALDVVVGDVSGHGIAAALIMSTARAFLRALHENGAALDAVVTSLNRLLAADLDDRTFMSLVACRLGEDGHTTAVSAGHESPLLWRAADGAFTTIADGGLLLGVDAEGTYERIDLGTLQRGDILVLFTDGMWECDDPQLQPFGLDRLRNVVAVAAAGGAMAVRDALIAAAQAHLAGAAPADDMTLVVVERR